MGVLNETPVWKIASMFGNLTSTVKTVAMHYEWLKIFCLCAIFYNGNELFS